MHPIKHPEKVSHCLGYQMTMENHGLIDLIITCWKYVARHFSFIYVENGKILKTIKHEVGINPMPQNASQLGDCSINTIEAWINQGALNN